MFLRDHCGYTPADIEAEMIAHVETPAAGNAEGSGRSEAAVSGADWDFEDTDEDRNEEIGDEGSEEPGAEPVLEQKPQGAAETLQTAASPEEAADGPQEQELKSEPTAALAA